MDINDRVALIIGRLVLESAAKDQQIEQLAAQLQSEAPQEAEEAPE